MMITSDRLLRENVQKNLCFYRKKRKMTQKDLAGMIGVTAAAISSWECGNNHPDIDTLFVICMALHVSLYDMCGITPDNNLISNDRNRLVKIYDLLNNDGKKKLLERAEELRRLGYLKQSATQKNIHSKKKP